MIGTTKSKKGQGKTQPWPLCPSTCGKTDRMTCLQEIPHDGISSKSTTERGQGVPGFVTR